MENNWTPRDLPGLMTWEHFEDGWLVKEGPVRMKSLPGHAPLIVGSRYTVTRTVFRELHDGSEAHMRMTSAIGVGANIVDDFGPLD